MKKLLILLFAAAVVGIAVSSDKDGGTGAPNAEGAPAATGGAHSISGGSPAVDEAPAPAAMRPRETVSERPAPASAVSPPRMLVARADGADAGAAKPAAAGDVKAAAEPVAVSAPDPVPAVLNEPAARALARADALVAEGKRVEARKILSALYLALAGQEARTVRDKLDAINRELVFNPRCVEGATVYTVVGGDTLTVIGGKTHVHWRLIARLNGMKEPYRMRVGRSLKVITGKPSIVAWKSEFRLALFVDGAYIREYPIGIGKDGKTPVGEFVIDNMVIRAPWTAPDGRIIRYGEPGYQLGERWLAFKDQPGANGLGIHGTPDSDTVGKQSSNGCLRMKNADVMELYDFTVLGTKVEIRG